MIILGIETSCDETALALIEANGDSLRVLGNITHSQAALHAKYGGVFPNLAKREHAKNLLPLLKQVLSESNLSKLSDTYNQKNNPTSYSDVLENIRMMLEREPGLWEEFKKFIPTIEKPPIDMIAVTFGPGLEPALWVGINFAKALSAVWNIPIVPVNHMEGHVFSALLCRKDVKDESGIPRAAKEKSSAIIQNSEFILHFPSFPALALLISGGHTELVLVRRLGQYEIIGETKDDAVGEAFDKVARILGLPYPGGPEISALAEQARSYKLKAKSFTLPRPMLHSGDYNFSFSGLKTAVLYTVKKIPKLTEEIKQEIALEFENAVAEVLISKTKKAVEHYGIQTLLIGGGVIANKHIKREFEKLAADISLPLYIPESSLTTDNALMIAVAGLVRHAKKQTMKNENLRAEGGLRLTS